MAFEIKLMYNNEPMNKISKTPQEIRTVSGVLRDESSIVDPIILIETANPIAANYAYIGEFNRYYFIRNWEAVRNGLWRCTMHTDVLKTFAEGILGSPCIVARSTSKKNYFLNDNMLLRQQNEYVFTQNFPSGFNLNNSRFILSLIGDRTQGS